MAKIGVSRITTDRDLMRNIKSTLDENVLTIGGFATGFHAGTPSSGTPIEVLASKGRLLASIAGISVFATRVESPEWLEQQNAQLRAENYTLKQIVRAIEERLTYIEATIPKERVVILRELSREEAEKEILELFAESQTLYYSDIAEKLGIDLRLVVEICNELQNKGEIEVVDDTLQRR